MHLIVFSLSLEGKTWFYVLTLIMTSATWRYLLLLSLFAVSQGQQGPYGYVWRETFEDLSNWVLADETGAATGNNEWEYYTSRPENVFLQSNGTGGSQLVIQALAESYNGYSYTSGKVYSQRMFGPYGFFNVKATVPKGNCLWPAIWLLPINSTPYGTWAACGEIDFMETVCTDAAAYSTLHFGGPWPNNVQGPANNVYPMTVDWSQAHTFGVEWQPTYIRFWLDAEIVNGNIVGQPFNEVTSDQWYSMNAEGVHYPGTAPFDSPFNIVMNIAMGGGWPTSVAGCCDNVAVPAQMVVDFVEVWEMVLTESLS